MAHLLVIGASKGIGRETVTAALDAGHRVRAMSRSLANARPAGQGLERIAANALSRADVEAALEGIDAVVQTLGVSAADLFRPVTLFSTATRVLLPAMVSKGMKRLITVTGFGAGESKAAIGCLERVPFRLLLGRAYDDKDVQERLIEASSLDWTIVRPGILTDGPRTGRYRVLVEPESWRNGRIARADVADFLVRQIADRTFLHTAPVLVR